MLWVEVHERTVLLRVVGQFGGRFAQEARLLIARRHSPCKLVMDLSDITLVDAVGEDVLLWISLIGGDFIARSLYSLNVCERLHLPLSDPFT